MSDVAIEEGCPVEPPTNLEEILARPMAPVANPLPPGVPHATPLVPAVGCDPVEQKKFSDCVQPLTAFQPHPLAVIRQPKQIDEACKEFRVFSSCRANVNCRPLWAEGMSAMFEFACGQGYNTFVQVIPPLLGIYVSYIPSILTNNIDTGIRFLKCDVFTKKEFKLLRK